jgi:hypothetical protein
MSYQTAQTTTKGVSFKSVMTTAAFNRGVREARSGKPLEYDAYTETNQQWAYERGRQFGLIYAGPVKEGRTVTREAIIAIRSATEDRVIF